MWMSVWNVYFRSGTVCIALTNQLKGHSAWTGNISSRSEEIPSILWNPDFHYRVHKSLKSVMSRINQINDLPSYLRSV
jgi:hypothetical protein